MSTGEFRPNATHIRVFLHDVITVPVANKVCSDHFITCMIYIFHVELALKTKFANRNEHDSMGNLRSVMITFQFKIICIEATEFT